ncbi:hypothetical protein CLAIMM_02072 [Cladophialophora immunda]|nr:hypothetical protein CLAIMM_02072 [Cladophialophora immunda]
MGSTIRPFNPPCTRIPPNAPPQCLKDDFFTAYEAILDDAIRLEEQDGEYKSQEFGQLIVVLIEILRWAEQHEGNKSRMKPLLERLGPFQKERKDLQKDIPADDCFCLLIRLLARRRQPATPDDYLREIKHLEVHKRIESGSFKLEESGLPNHLSICLGPHTDPSESNIRLHVISTNGEHDRTKLGKWAEKCRKERFRKHGSNVLGVVNCAAEWLERRRENDARKGIEHPELSFCRFYDIEAWKVMSTQAKPDENRVDGPRAFWHTDELGVTFRFENKSKVVICARCCLCRMVFCYRQCKATLELENDFKQGLKSVECHLYKNNTCSEGLLHVLCELCRIQRPPAPSETDGDT